MMSYVTFLVAGETYAVAIESVREVITWVPVTRVPHAAASVRGVINLRGEIVPVLDLRVQLGSPATDPTDRTCIVIVRAGDGGGRRAQAGLVVDAALDIVRLAAAELQLRRDMDSAVAGAYVAAVARTKTGLTMMLDVDRVIVDGFRSPLAAP
jgi:purine-binding chemotaxis protein CheW